MIVADASAIVPALLRDGAARKLLGEEDVFVPHLVDSEVAQTLRRYVLAGKLAADDGWAALRALRALGVTRYPSFGLLDRVWALRENLSAYDATYVAVAEALDCSLVTADGRLARAPGIRCSITVVPPDG